MIRSRFRRYIDRIRGELHDAFTEDYTPAETARSFALGTFITMLPTLGTGLLVFVVLATFFERVSKIALLASVVVFNPAVKWGVYAASFTLGVLLLGPLEGVSMTDVSFRAGPEIVLRLLVGNIILAVIATIGSYTIALRLADRYQTSEVGETISGALEEIADDVFDE